MPSRLLDEYSEPTDSIGASRWSWHKQNKPVQVPCYSMQICSSVAFATLCVCVRECVCVRACLFACMSVCLPVCLYVCRLRYTPKSVPLHTHIYICICTFFVYIHIYKCMYILNLFLRMRIHERDMYVHAFIYIYVLLASCDLQASTQAHMQTFQQTS